MREMVLNQASLSAPDRTTALDWLREVAVGMSVLVSEAVSEPALRSSLYSHEIRCVGDWTLSDAYNALRSRGARDESLFLLRLESKAPLLNKVAPEIEDRFLRCEDRTLLSPDGNPLLFCAISDGIAVGFPSDRIWDRSELTVDFLELLPNGVFDETSETIDNLARTAHALLIVKKNRARMRENLGHVTSGNYLWQETGNAFPNLVFGIDVENQLKQLNTGDMGTIVNKLSSLDDTAVSWRKVADAMPPWHSKVTNESLNVRNSPTLSQYRWFRSSDGSRHPYFWHARFGSSGRIHLRFIRQTYRIEIGYIGPHLPL